MKKRAKENDTQTNERPGPWRSLHNAVSGATERLAGTVEPRIIVYIFPDGSRAWRYASELTLRREDADKITALVGCQIKQGAARQGRMKVA